MSSFHFASFCSYTNSWSVRWLPVTILMTGAETIYKTKWLPQRLLFIQLKIVFVTISSSTQQMRPVHRDVQEEWHCLESLLKSCLRLTAPNVTEAKWLFHGIIGMTNIQVYTGSVSMQYCDTTIHRYTAHPYVRAASSNCTLNDKSTPQDASSAT